VIVRPVPLHVAGAGGREQLPEAGPMRKLLLSLGIMCFMAGLVIAAEGTITKVDTDKKEITVKEGDKETTYKYTDKVKVTLVTGKQGEEKETEGKYEDFENRLKKFNPDSKRGNKITFESKEGTITSVKIRAGGKGK
jgi:hypothetical protein